MSKTDHARLPGTHRAGHVLRAWRKDDERGWRLPVRPHVSLAEEVAEGLALVHAPLDLDESFAVRECMDQFEDLDQWHDGDDLRMAYWEVALEAGIGQDEAHARGVVWTTKSDDSRVGHENMRSLEREAKEDEAWDDTPMTFLSPVGTGELHDLFPDGGYIVEGPSAYEPSGKAHAHMYTSAAHKGALSTIA